MTNKEVFTDACQRCHGIKYADMQKGTMAAFTPDAEIKNIWVNYHLIYLNILEVRGHEYLETFVNNPQKHLEGTAMPRVGLNEESQAQVVAYLQEIGDSKKLKEKN